MTRTSRAPAANPLPPLTFPSALPVSERRLDIAQAIQEHQVVIVCGETGSGKTTQLPKIALSLGRGRAHTGRLIGHTQPRRIAASSVAKRIAQELGSPLGEHVGYKVRFNDKMSAGASVKLMTDGILLAETQTDPLLKAYDTLIIDEAHERSLNIDFLLGYLLEILPRRPDLKVIVTSATIDADRFAQHFASAKGPAPVIQVSGRLFPVEVRYRPPEENTQISERDLPTAIADAVDELWREGDGDILIFLPGEREIREATDHLHKHHLAQTHRRGPVEILPLYARLSQAEQDRVFEVGGARRIVLATNVAETSLTVPGIRYVIDTGTARVKRYSYRNKVEQLQVEAISQAAANQRSGRCGRVADGICIRLYAQAEFQGRSRFTDPEILRSSLGGVILRMKALHLGEVESFPFVDPPPRKAIADGYQLLHELGAVDEQNALTPMGQALSKLPLDPRIGRMILEAKERQALSEVLVIAAALSTQDVRDRPLDAQQAADEKHKRFDDERSEFTGYLKLWDWIHEAKGVHGHAPASAAGPSDTPKLSNRQQEKRLREHFINPRRVREWRDIYTQLHMVVAEQQWRLNTAPATYDQLHMSMLAGLLGNIGCKSDSEEWYLGARGIKFWRHPGAHLSKKPGRWLVAAELVDTTRLFGRGLAAIQPEWLPPLAGHLIKTQLLEPHWEKKPAEVVALERATLYGLVLYNNKRVNFGRVDATAARELFIRHALVEQDWDSKHPFLAHNNKLMTQVQELENKSRRQDVLVDEELIYAFYDQQLPSEVCSGSSFDRWYREAVKTKPKLLMLTRDELMRHEAAGVTTQAFPKTLRLGGIDCSVTYTFDPGHPRDGLTVTVPVFALNQITDERCEWLVPGMLKDKVMGLLKSLHQRPRSRLVPLPDYVEHFIQQTPFAQGSLIEHLLEAVRQKTSLDIKQADFKLDMLAAHHFMNFVVIDEHGRQLGMGRNLSALKAEWGATARSAFQQLAALKTVLKAPAPAPDLSHQSVTSSDQKPQATPYTEWTFGELPELMEITKGKQTLVGFPALIDKQTHVVIEVFDEPDLAQKQHAAGLRRLVALQLKEPLKYLEKNIPELQKMAVQFMTLGSSDDLREQIVHISLERAFLQEPWPTNAEQFAEKLAQGRPRLNLIAQEVARLAGAILTEYNGVLRKLKDSRPSKELAEDIQSQLQALMPKKFLLVHPYAQLQHFTRYLKAIHARLDKWRADPARDTLKMNELRPLEQRYVRLLSERKGVVDERLQEYRWLLEELRVSFFAQELRTPQPVSAKRLDKAWVMIQR